LQFVVANLYYSHVILPFFYHLLAIPPSCNSYPCTIYLCYKGFLVGSMPDGATMKPRAYSEQSTHASTARHMLVLKLLIMIPYTTMSVYYLLVGIPPHLAFVVLPGNLYTGPKSSESFFRIYEGAGL